jgi:hypothetical protein
MSILVDYKYANLLATRLPKYKLKKPTPFLAICRCIKCGDSKTHANKARFYVYEKGGRVKTFCHNCGYSHQIGFFLKEFFPDMYKEYIMDIFQEKKLLTQNDTILTIKKPAAELGEGPLKGLKRISQLHHNHPAKQYIEGRKIPPEAHSRLYFTVNFCTWINELVPGKFEKTPKYDPRIVIPFFDKKGNVFAVQGRAISDKQSTRYITIRFDEEHPKVYGIDKVDPNFRVWVLEGPIDSLFILNAVAMAGADISLSELGRLLNVDKDRLVKVYDNEPRSDQIVKRMRQDVDDGYKVVIWPKSIIEKDVNNMVLKQGLSPENILMIMKKHTYQGLEAQLKLAAWGKVGTS